LISSNASNASAPISVKPNYTMGEGGHEKGINCVDFYGGSDRPFLVTGSDDHTVRIWDYHTKNCVRVLEGHTNNVSAVIFHPQLPFLLSAGEDSTLRIWNAQTFRLEASYNFSMERAWGIACCRAHNSIGVAFDSGTIVFQLGKGDPCASMDPIQGRLVWSRARGSGSAGSHGNEILTGIVRLLDVEGRPIRIPADSEVIPLTPKELGTSDVFPQNLQHSPDGRLVAVWGDGEYVIYSTIGWRNRAFGRGVEIAWAAPGGDIFASRESSGRVLINRVSAHDQGISLQGASDCDRIFGGPLLGVSMAGSTLSFFDWSGNTLVRTIDVVATSVSWSPDASHVAIQTESSCYILSANALILKSPQSYESGEDGIEDALELVDELEQPLKSVTWISGNCFVYLTEENRLAYHMVGGDADESFQLALFDRSQFLLGFLPSEQRVYLTDQDLQVTSFAIMPSLIEFQSQVLAGGDLTVSLSLLESIPSTYYARLAVFLQRRGYLREALKISPDAHFQFDLALQLNDLNLARELLSSKMAGEQEKWQELGRVALKAWNLPIAEEALNKSGDLASLFLLYAAAGDADGLISVGKEAAKKPGHVNLAFAAYVKAGAYIPAFELLLSEGRAPEAALFARTYGLNAESVAKAVEMWRVALIGKKKEKVSGALADPVSNVDKFSGCQFGVTGSNTGNSASNAQPPRGRSVSFDGNVSVAGSSSTISLKPAYEETVEDVYSSAASTITSVSASATVGAGVGLANLIDDYSSEKYQVDTAGLSDDQMSMEVNTAGTGTRIEELDEDIICEEDGDDGEEPEYESSIAEKEREYDTISEENEDDTEGEGGYYEEDEPFPEATEISETFSGIVNEPTDETKVEITIKSSVFEEKDDLLEELNNLHVEESFNEAVLGVVEEGGDIYDVIEAEYPIYDAEGDYEPIDEPVIQHISVTESCLAESDNIAEVKVSEEAIENNYDSVVDKVYDGGYEAFEYPTETFEDQEYTNDNVEGYVNYYGTDYNIDNGITDDIGFSEDYSSDISNGIPQFNQKGFDSFEYPAESEQVFISTAHKKEKGSDAEAEAEAEGEGEGGEQFEVEEIDFGGDGDTDGWL
jgi:coatomer subunit beta'